MIISCFGKQSNKGSSGSDMKLVEKDKILQDDKNLAVELNIFLNAPFLH